MEMVCRAHASIMDAFDYWFSGADAVPRPLLVHLNAKPDNTRDAIVAAMARACVEKHHGNATVLCRSDDARQRIQQFLDANLGERKPDARVELIVVSEPKVILRKNVALVVLDTCGALQLRVLQHSVVPLMHAKGSKTRCVYVNDSVLPLELWISEEEPKIKASFI